jgi:outer membrane protein TolC
LEYREAVLRGVAEVEIALGTLERDTVRESEAERAAAALQRGMTAATRRAELQLASPLTANSVALIELDGELALIDARTVRGLAYVALYKALGGAPRPAPETR